jgi:hypothetical protein
VIFAEAQIINIWEEKKYHKSINLSVTNVVIIGVMGKVKVNIHASQLSYNIRYAVLKAHTNLLF